MNVCKVAHPLKGLVERARREGFHVIDIAGDQYVPGRVFAGKLAEADNRPQTRFLKESHCRIIDKPEYLSDLPI
tara:strand:- start:351 stop:572 length:222 start_codon:yes stop_codon:yes gene_type:complete